MDDDWDDSPSVPISVPPIVNALEDGHAVRGRGFVAFKKEDTNGHNGVEDGGGGGGGYERRGRGGFRGRGRGTSRGGGSSRDYGDDDGDHYRGDSGRGRSRGGHGGGRQGGHGDEEQNVDGKSKAPVTYVPPDPTTDENEMFGSNICTGINFDKFDNIAVKVTGENVPAPIDNFDSAGLRKFVLDNVIKSGYKKPTPIQKHAIPIIMSGRDLMGCAQTGSGKTAAFLVPMINMLLDDNQEPQRDGHCVQPQVIIVSPTRELTLQIFEEARKFSHGSVLKVCVAYGGTSVRHQSDIVSRGCHILVATPGRLHDFVARRRISFEAVKFVVLDEADRMLDMGFMPDVEKMIEHPSMSPKGDRQTLMFSATFPDDIQHLASKFLDNYLFVAVGIVGGASTDVDQEFHEVSSKEKRKLLSELIANNRGKRMLVFVETRRNADFLASYLSEENCLASSIHGDRLQQEREEALHHFKSGRHPILVATAVAARGLDIKNVDIVVNFDLPKNIDEYVHRIGRTGRVGNRGRAISFFDSRNDMPLLPELSRILKQAGQNVPDFMSGGGTAYGGNDNYGANDIRNFDSVSAPAGDVEPEEEW